MGGSSKLAPPAQSSACPEGPEPRSGEGVNPMLCGACPLVASQAHFPITGHSP
mgnify:FL=1